MERNATVRTFEIAAVLTAVLALYLLALAAIESVPSLQRRVDDTGVMFGLMALLVLTFAALPFAHAAWRRREGPARGEAAPLAPAAAGDAAGGYGAAGAAGGSFAPHAAAAGSRAPVAATEMARLSSLPADDVAAAEPDAASPGYCSSDDEGAEAAAAAAADAAAGAPADVEEVFGASKYYAGGSTTLRDAFSTPDYWLTVGIMFLNNAVAYSLLKCVSYCFAWHT